MLLPRFGAPERATSYTPERSVYFAATHMRCGYFVFGFSPELLDEIP
jgi:hypothetical protein